jgi:hypothetical protein
MDRLDERHEAAQVADQEDLGRAALSAGDAVAVNTHGLRLTAVLLPIRHR